jgi:hypothetical protein
MSMPLSIYEGRLKGLFLRIGAINLVILSMFLLLTVSHFFLLFSSFLFFQPQPLSLSSGKRRTQEQCRDLLKCDGLNRDHSETSLHVAPDTRFAPLAISVTSSADAIISVL